MKIRIIDKPIKRSRLRLISGKIYYKSLRYLQWYFGRDTFAKDTSHRDYSYIIYKHKTPLLRKLQGVDMQLQYNKVKNLEIAAKKLNGVVIKSGETFSYWKLIGKPTYRKGYLDGLVLNPDGTFKSGVGGGLCQLSNLIYWMTIHTPLIIKERYRHGHDIFPDINRKQPFGSGATCVYNYLDLQIYNATDSEYQLAVSLNDTHLFGEWRSNEIINYRYEVYEKEHYISSTYWGGYIRNNTIYRRKFNELNEIISDEFLTRNSAIMMYRPLLEKTSPTLCKNVFN